MFKEFLKDTTGATAVEYGLLMGLFGLFLVASASLLGNSISDFFVDAGAKLDAS